MTEQETMRGIDCHQQAKEMMLRVARLIHIVGLREPIPSTFDIGEATMFLQSFASAVRNDILRRAEEQKFTESSANLGQDAECIWLDDLRAICEESV